jgi:hypothetical protein
MILIYQMTKVASRTWLEVARSAAGLEAAEPIHVHFIARQNLEVVGNIGAMISPFQTIANRILLREMLRKGPAAQAAIDEARRVGRTIKVITGMRDPVARSLSIVHFFGDFYGDTSRPLDGRSAGDGATTAGATAKWWRTVLSNDEPEDSFARLMTFLIGGYRSWFTDEFASVLGFDLGMRTFSFDDGAERLSGDGVEVLLYRVEDMAPDAARCRALLAQAADFLGVPISRFPEINTAATRRSYPRYQAARALLRLPAAFLAAIYDAPIVSRFYSSAEIAAFKAQWSSPG